jgi:hypothetical protein
MYHCSARKTTVLACFLLFVLIAGGSRTVTQAATATIQTAKSSDQSRSVASLPLPGGQVITGTDSITVPMELYAPELMVSRAPDTSLSTSTYLIADIAVEVDYALYKKLGSDTTRTEQYVRSLLAAVSAIYARDVHIVLNVSFIRVSTSANEVWTATDTLAALYQVQNYWIANESTRSRAAVLFLSGKNLGGGIAYLPGICSNTYGYAVIGNLAGTFTTVPSQSTWDLVSTAHELGHSFGSMHSHCYKKANGSWYDRCYSAEDGCYSGPTVAGKGTIMSYCHMTSPYMANIDPISFLDTSSDPAMVNDMRSLATNRVSNQASGCLRAVQPKVYVPSVGSSDD